MLHGVGREQRKHVQIGARVGIHGAAEGGVETDRATRATVVMARLDGSYGIPDAIVGRMVRTPPDRIVWLSPAEVQSIVGEVAFTP